VYFLYAACLPAAEAASFLSSATMLCVDWV
jgi:hypothetical protein